MLNMLLRPSGCNEGQRALFSATAFLTGGRYFLTAPALLSLASLLSVLLAYLNR